MARNQIDKYLNQLDIRQGDYIDHVQKKYKFSRFKQTLSILKRASFHHTISPKIISEIELVFNLMPVHELYHIKSTQEEIDDYLKKLNELYISVLDNYDNYTEIIPTNNYRWFTNVFFMILIFHENIEKRIGLDILPFLILALIFSNLYQYRDRFWRNPFKT